MLADVLKEKEKEQLLKAKELEELKQIPIKEDVIIYHPRLNSIGGIETWLYTLAKLYQPTIMYKQSDLKQLERLNKYTKTIHYVGQEKIECNTMIYATPEYIPANATRKMLVYHADAKFQDKPVILDGLELYAVSKEAQKNFSTAVNKNVGLLYNPIIKEDSKPLLKILVISRGTKEKGIWRVKEAINRLSNSNYPWLMYIFTDIPFECTNARVIFMKPTLDIATYIDDCTYVMQLSDTESSCYSIKESLIRNKPIIVTKLPMLKDEGIDEKVAKIIEFDMSNFDVDDIYNNVPIVNDYKPKQSDKLWEEIFNESKRKK